MPQAELGSVLGASRPKVNLALSNLADAGAIRRAGSRATCDIETVACDCRGSPMRAVRRCRLTSVANACVRQASWWGSAVPKREKRRSVSVLNRRAGGLVLKRKRGPHRRLFLRNDPG